MRELVLSLIPALALATAAGCIGASDPLLDFVPQDARPLTQFKADVVIGGDAGTMRLASPVEVPLPNGTVTTGHELRIEIPDTASGKPFQTAYYLDGSFRIIALRTDCPFLDCSKTSSWSWQGFGDLPHFGIGLPALLANDDLVAYTGNRATPASATTELHDNGTLELQLAKFTYASNQTIRQVYWYQPGRWLPDGPDVEVKSYEAGDVAGEVPRQDFLREMPSPRPWEGTMFPEEGQDHFGVGFSHLEIVQEAADGQLGTDGVCIQGYHLHLALDGDGEDPLFPPRIPLPSQSDKLVAWVDVFILRGPSFEHVRVDVVENESSGERRLDAESQASVPAHLTCRHMQRSPWPTLTPSAAFDKASNMDFRKGELSSFLHFVGSPRFRGQTAEGGWHTYDVFFVPSHIGSGNASSAFVYDPYQVGFDAYEQARLYNLQLHPDDAGWTRN